MIEPGKRRVSLIAALVLSYGATQFNRPQITPGVPYKCSQGAVQPSLRKTPRVGRSEGRGRVGLPLGWGMGGIRNARYRIRGLRFLGQKIVGSVSVIKAS